MPQPGDRLCGSCGEANDPTRKFCRRCGSSLVQASIVAEKRLPWWRRIFTRKPKTYAAGERTRSMKPGSRDLANTGLRLTYVFRWVVGVLFFLGVVGYVAIPSFQGLVLRGVSTVAEQVRRIVSPALDIERPVVVRASSESEDHEARLLFDTFSNTEWHSTEANPTITVEFKAPVELGALIVHSGAAEAFVDFRRPSRLELTFTDGSTASIDLQDIHDPQQFELSAQGVDSILIRVVDTNGPSDAAVVLSELEFFRKR